MITIVRRVGLICLISAGYLLGALQPAAPQFGSVSELTSTTANLRVSWRGQDTGGTARSPVQLESASVTVNAAGTGTGGPGELSLNLVTRPQLDANSAQLQEAIRILTERVIKLEADQDKNQAAMGNVRTAILNRLDALPMEIVKDEKAYDFLQQRLRTDFESIFVSR
ncbi:hypothetical protein [Bradyrhizobium guangzhouense]|uniref:Uncharacterized protein n=1 Tax=Bradyrhizobium guangzhouense TaxID=1325095 RepID=A0AAE5X6N5_9BRAD|nr:hypothetical protein [Bradyrhizobium guangzhouense]QAU49681.1 hypothetical protein XH91_32820 [Bradyrhizobium guangzhouense]